ncbi:DUF1048 domain-containing protein [Gordonia sp. DT219]|uniref:DUF1048 domain-containing protein n=1 Tax=Gordonia sp. DT219 TaxID=3416658 RepID=UPI003CF2882A
MVLRKLIGDKKRWRAYKARKDALPDTHRDVLDAVEHYIYFFASSETDALMSLLEDLTDLFEQAAADGTEIADLVGTDPIEFAEGFLRNYPEASWIHREHKRLTTAVDKAIAAEHHPTDARDDHHLTTSRGAAGHFRCRTV